VDGEDYIVMNMSDPEAWWEYRCYKKWKLAEDRILIDEAGRKLG
jgi:hypothetical protein